MRILLSCLQSERRHALPGYAFWRGYFVEGCAEAGIECVEVPGLDWAEGLTHPPGPALDCWRANAWQRVVDFVRADRARNGARAPLAMFLGYLYPQQVDTAAIRELQRQGLPCVNFYCDNVRQFHRLPEAYRAFALHWVPEYEALPLYRDVPHVHAPMPCWVHPRWRTLPERETEPPTMIGSADVLRRDVLARAIGAGAELRICGRGWNAADEDARPRARGCARAIVANQLALVREHGPRALWTKVHDRLRPLTPPAIPDACIGAELTPGDYLRVTRGARVTIGINRVPTARRSLHAPLAYSRLRDIEAPMLGACHLTEWTAGLPHLYDIGAEIECWRDPVELADKIAALSRDPARRRRMRRAAQARALGEHAVPRTLHRLLDRLGLAAHARDPGTFPSLSPA
jgi:hypothetical protein